MAVILGSASGKIEIDASGVKSGAAAAAAAMEGVSRAGREMSASLGLVARDAKAFESNLRPVGQALVGVSAGLTLAGVASVKSAAEFEASMNVFQATARASGKEMAQVGDLAKALGADMSLPATSAVGAGKAMTELAKAGLSVSDAMAAAKGTLQLAIAGQLSEAEAASIAAAALNSFGLAGKEAERIANLLAAAYTASGSSVEELGLALKQSSAVYSAAGIPVEDLTAAIAEMGRAGIRSMDAGTSLKQMLLSLQAPTSKAKGLMEELGIRVYDARGAMLPFRDVIGNVQGALKDLTQEQRNEALAVMFGSDAVRAANIVMMGGVDAFDKMKASVTAGGAAADLSAARMKGLTGATENLKSQAETASLAIGQALSPAITDLVNKAAEAVAAFNTLSPAMQGMAAGGLAITAAVTGAVGGFILLAPKIIEGYGAMVQFAAYGKDVVTGLQLMKAGFTGAEVATTGFAGATAAALPVVLALTLAVVAAYKAYELHQQVVRQTAEVGNAYAQMLKDQAAAGKSVEDVMVEYAATQERVNRVYEAAPWYLKPFIDKQSIITAGAQEYVKVLGDSSLAQAAYEAEMRKAAASMGLEVDEAGNLIRVTQAMGATNTEVVQTNYMMSESQRRVGQALKDTTAYTADFTVEQLRANKTVVQATQDLGKDTKATEDLRDAQAGLADSALDLARTFADGNAKYTERADLERQLADLGTKIAAQGTAHVATITKTTMTTNELTAANSKLYALEEGLWNIKRKKSETDAELNARIDAQRVAVDNLKNKIGEATGVIGAHTAMVGGATAAQEKEYLALVKKLQAIDQEIQKELAQQAVESLTPEMFGTGAAAATGYAAAKRDLMLATGLVTKESLAEKDSIDILTATLVAGQITPAQYAIALGKVKGASADGVVSLRELTGSITSLSGTKFSLKNMDEVRQGIVGPLKAARADAIAAGADISAGMAQGVTSGALAFSGSLKGVVDTGVLGIRTAYMMQSPSLVMAGMGVDFLQGLTNGVIEGRAILEPEIVATGLLFTTVLQPTFVATAAMLNGLLKSSFEAVATVVGKTVIPQWEAMDKFIKDEMSKALASLRNDQLVPTAAAFSGVAGAAGAAEEAIRGAARAASSFHMPNFGSSGGSAAGTAGERAQGGPVNAGVWTLHNNEYVLSEAMRRGLQPVPVEAFYPEAGSRVAAPSAPINKGYGNRVTIYGGLTLNGVQNAQSLLAELQAMA